MNYEFFQLPHPFNPQLSPLKVRASERDVSLLTNRSVPTRSISVGCDKENFSSPEELRLVAHQPKLNNEVVNPKLSTLNSKP